MTRSSPLVGRAEELALVVAAVDEQAGAVVRGRAGIGKSALIAAALEALPAGRRVVRAIGSPLEAGVPFAAFGSLWPAQGPAPNANQLFRHLTKTIVDGSPVLLVIEDAHRLDSDSAELIEHLVTTAGARLLASARTGESVPSAVDRLCDSDGITQVVLQALARSESDDLVRSMLEGQVGQLALDLIWSIAGGVPLWIRELVLDARAGGHLVTRRGVWVWDGQVDAGPRLADVAGLRVDRLSAAAVRGLRQVAYGQPLPLDIVAELIPDAALAELLDAQVVSADDGALRVAHALHGEVMRAKTPALVARAIKAEVADALLAAGPPDPGDELRVALLAVEGGRTVATELVLHASVRAMRLGDHALVERLLLPLRDDLRGRAGILLGDALRMSGRTAEAAAVLAAVDLARLTDAQVVHWAMLQSVTAASDVDDFVTIDAVLARAGEAVSEPAWRDYLTAQLAALYTFAGRIRDGGQLAEPLLTHSSAPVRLRALTPAGVAMMLSGRQDDAIELSEQMLGDAVAHATELPEAPLWTLSVAIAATVYAGDLPRLASQLDLVDAAGPGRANRRSGFISAGRGRLELARGRPAAAEPLLRQAASDLDQTEGMLRWALALVAEACAHQGDRAGSERAWAEAEALGPWQVQLPFEREAARSGLWVEVARGDVAAAVARALELADQAASDGFSTQELLALHEALRLGRRVDVVERLVEVAPRVQGPWAVACAHHARGIADDDGAALILASEAFAALGAHRHAAETAFAAAESFERHHLAAEAQAATAAASGYESHTEGPPLAALLDTGLTPLTRREREIAQLAADGMTNRAIADELHIAQRTVDTHLTRIFTKLGINRRSDLEQWLP